MLLSLAQWLQTLSPEFGFFRVFQYLTFRAVMAALTALLIGLAFGPWVIRRLAELKIGQPIREYGVKEHLAKSGTPTMGGVLILIGIGVATLLWFDWSNRFVWVVMGVTFGFGAIGWVDDWRKVVDKNPEGMRSREKYLWQSLIGLVAAGYLAFAVSETPNLRVLELFLRWITSGFSTELPPRADLMVPFFKTVSYPLGVFGFIAVTYFVIVGASNADAVRYLRHVATWPVRSAVLTGPRGSGRSLMGRLFARETGGRVIDEGATTSQCSPCALRWRAMTKPHGPASYTTCSAWPRLSSSSPRVQPSRQTWASKPCGSARPRASASSAVELARDGSAAIRISIRSPKSVKEVSRMRSVSLNRYLQYQLAGLSQSARRRLRCPAQLSACPSRQPGRK